MPRDIVKKAFSSLKPGEKFVFIWEFERYGHNDLIKGELHMKMGDDTYVEVSFDGRHRSSVEIHEIKYISDDIQRIMKIV